jgi:hypothetical protein
MSTTVAVEYKVVSFDADSTVTELSEGLSKTGTDGWALVSTYHLHHLNTIHYVFSRSSSSAPK